ncbi:MAG: ATP-binding protein, partial [Thermosphaera sp.]
RRELIEEYKKLSNEKKSRLAELKELKELLLAKNNQIREMEKEARTPTAILREEINRLEWQLQTRVLTLEEENRIISKIKRLKELLDKAEALRRERNSTLEMKALLSSIRIQVEDLTKKMKLLRDEINKLTQERDALKSKIDEIIKRNLELKSLINEKQERVNKLSALIDEYFKKQADLREKISQLQKELEKSKVTRIIDLKKQEIMEKLKRGGKLTIEELKILYGEPDDLISE